MTNLDFRLFGNLKSVVDLDTQISNRRFQLGVSKEQLHCAKVLSASIDQRSLGPSNRMGSILGTLKTMNRPVF
jgi:hypothetical protein